MVNIKNKDLFGAKQTEDENASRDRYIKSTLRELLLYLGFVVIMCIMTYSYTSATMYYFTKNTKDLFVDDDMTGQHQTKDFFWEYTKNNLLDGLYWEEHYNGEKVTKDEKGYIFFESKILCTPRLLQRRVKEGVGCRIASIFKKIEECYGEFSDDTEETRPFGKYEDKMVYNNESNGWVYNDESKGYVVLLGDSKTTANDTINDLEEYGWLGRPTRVVTIEFTIYNANINLFCIVTLVFTFPELGGMEISSNINTLKMLRYVTDWDYFVLALECVFILYLVYYTIEEVMEMFVRKKEYWKSGWNIYDLVILLMGWIAVGYSVYVYHRALDLLKKVADTKGEEFVDFGRLGYKERRFSEMVAVFILLTWIKIFKFLNFNKTMMHLGLTLKRCAKDVFAFVIMFLIVFLGFAAWGYKTFGAHLESFSTFATTMITLFRLILGDFNFAELKEVRPVIGPIYFVLYVLLIFFVLINMFLAIINDTYVAVGEDLDEEEIEFDLGNYLSRGYQKMIDKLALNRKKIVDIQTALLEADTNQDNQIDYSEWRTKLKSMGHAEVEIESMFCKYDKDGDHVLNEVEWKEMQDDIAGQKAEVDQEMENVTKEMEEEENKGDNESCEEENFPKIPTKKFTVLRYRVDRLEHSMGSILSKVDLVMEKMKGINEGISQRRQTLNRVFEGMNDIAVSRDGNNMFYKLTELYRHEFKKWDKWDGKDIEESDKWDAKDNEEGDEWDAKDIEEIGKWDVKDIEESGKWDAKDKEESGKCDVKDIEESGKWDAKDKEESVKGDAKDIEESGKWEVKDIDESGEWDVKDVDQSGKHSNISDYSGYEDI